jgi:predicted MFS family arabinose efflux permease
MGISLFVYIAAPNFLWMLVGETIFALGVTFRSGTEQAVLYDTLKNNDMTKSYPKIEGIARSNQFYAQALGSLAAGFLFEMDMYLPFYVSVVFLTIAAIIALFYVEPHVDRTFQENNSYFKQITESFNYAFKNKRVFSIILFSVIFMLFYRIGFNYFQPYMKAVNIPVRYFGVIFFLFNMIAAYASKNAQQFLDKTKPRSLMMICLLVAVSFIFLSVTKLWVGVGFIFLQQLARGYRIPVFQKYINKRIPSDKRATIISIQSFSHSIAIAVLGPLAGLLLDKTNIFFSHLVVGLVMLLTIFVANLYMLKASKEFELTQGPK